MKNKWKLWNPHQTRCIYVRIKIGGQLQQISPSVSKTNLSLNYYLKYAHGPAKQYI